MKYKTELHCHTAEISHCSSESGAQVAEKFIAHGYTTLTVTNHFLSWIAQEIDGETWEQTLDRFYGAVDLVREAAGDRLHVLTGLELRLDGDPNDYLVFGIERDALVDIPDIFKCGIDKAHEILNERGAIVIQAHPFRFGLRLIHPEYVDGYEIANGHPGHHSHNDLAEAWGRRFVNHHPILTTGTDVHHPDHIPNSGIMTDAPITTNAELLSVLRSGDFELIRPQLEQDQTI